MAYRVAPVRLPLEWYVEQELKKVEQALTIFDFVRLTKLSVSPTKLVDGLVVYADGTNWNPGSGEGVYAYYGGSWKKLG